MWAWARRWTNEDLTLLWAAARDWGRLRPRQPNFWGQTYGTTFESIPSELLRWMGIGYPTGLPLVISAGHLAMWWIPAAAAWRRGHRLACCLALAVPLMLTDEYLIITSVYATVAGRVLASVALSMVILADRRFTWVAAASGLAALAFVFDSSTLLVTAPACVYALTVVRRDLWGRTSASHWVRLALCMVPAAGWMIFTWQWYRSNPGDALHPAPSLRPALRILTENLRAPGHLFTMFSPEWLRTPTLVLAVIIAAVVAVIATRRLPQALAGLAFLLVLLVAIAIPKSQDQLNTVYFPAARAITLLPLAVWFLVLIGPRPRRPLSPTLGPVALVVVVGLTAAVRLGTWSERGGAELAAAVSFPQYPLTKNTDLAGQCARIRAASADNRAPIAIFLDRTAAYGCAGLTGDSIITSFPPYDRRSWILRRLDEHGDRRILLVGSSSASCDGTHLRCSDLGQGLTIVELGGRTPVEAVQELAITVRPF